MGRRRMRFRCCTDIFFHPPTASAPSGYSPWTGIGITGFIIFELVLCIRTLRFRIRGIIIDPLSFCIGDIFCGKKSGICTQLKARQASISLFRIFYGGDQSQLVAGIVACMGARMMFALASTIAK